MEFLLPWAAPLTEYAWASRYPADPKQPPAEEDAAALVTAREVIDTVLRRFPSVVGPQLAVGSQESAAS